MKIKDEQFIDWESDTFGFGYGTGEKYTIKALKDFFGLLKEDRQYDFEIVEEKLGKLGGWLMINILCRAGIIDYGTSPRYGWLSEKGEKLRDYVQTKSVDELYELITEINDNYTHCGRNYCNCNPPESFNKRCPNNEFF